MGKQKAPGLQFICVFVSRSDGYFTAKTQMEGFRVLLQLEDRGVITQSTLVTLDLGTRTGGGDVISMSTAGKPVHLSDTANLHDYIMTSSSMIVITRTCH